MASRSPAAHDFIGLMNPSFRAPSFLHFGGETLSSLKSIAFGRQYVTDCDDRQWPADNDAQLMHVCDFDLRKNDRNFNCFSSADRSMSHVGAS